MIEQNAEGLGPKILIVDDEQDLLAVLTARLEAAGYRVITARDGDIALRVFEEESPNLVLLDVRMPYLDGIEVLREMVAFDPECKIIVVSGHISKDQARLALEEGACDFIPKPIDLEHLRETLEMMLILSSNR